MCCVFLVDIYIYIYIYMLTPVGDNPRSRTGRPRSRQRDTPLAPTGSFFGNVNGVFWSSRSRTGHFRQRVLPRSRQRGISGQFANGTGIVCAPLAKCFVCNRPSTPATGGSMLGRLRNGGSHFNLCVQCNDMVWLIGLS